MMLEFIKWLLLNIWTLIVVFFIVVYGKRIVNIFIIQPIQGKDERTSMPELAQFVMVVCLVVMVFTDTPPYSYEKLAVMALGVAAIAGVQIYRDNKKPPTPPTGSGI